MTVCLMVTGEQYKYGVLQNGTQLSGLKLTCLLFSFFLITFGKLDESLLGWIPVATIMHHELMALIL